MAKKKVTETVAEILLPFLEEEGYELYHSEFVKEGGDWFLRVYIDMARDGREEAVADGEDAEACEAAAVRYVGTEDCEKVSRYLSEKLDEADPVQQNYYLEVSSPGMDRPLITPRHYELAVGKEIEIKLYKAVDGRKNIRATLKEAGGDRVTVLSDEGREMELNMTDIAKAKMAIVL